MVVLFSVLLSCFVILQDHTVQTILGRIVAEEFSKKFNTKIKIKELTVNAYFDLILKGVEVLDLNHNELINSERIQLSFEKAGLYSRDVILNKVKIDNSNIDLRVYKNTSRSNVHFLLAEAIFKQDSIASLDTLDIEKAKWLINCKKVEISNSSFSFINENMEVNEGVDFDHIEISSFNMNMDNLFLQGDSLAFRINELSLKEEKSGFGIQKFSGDFILSARLLDAKNLKVEAMTSKLDLDFNFRYNSFKDFNRFEQKIKIETNIRPTRLNLADIGYFAPDIRVMENTFNFSLKAQGTVSNFKSRNIRFDYGEITRFEGDLAMRGLPDILTTHNTIKIKKLITSADDLNNFAIPGALTYLGLPGEFSKLGKCEIIGNLKGVYNEFDANVTVRSDAGNFSTVMTMNTNETGDSTIYRGTLKSLHFDLGKVFDIQNYFGKHNLDVSFVGNGIDREGATLKLEGVVDSLDFKGNNYNHIKVDGLFAENKFNGHLNINDEDLDLKFDGLINFGKKNPVYNFKAKIDNAHIFDLGLYKRDSTAVLSTDLDINFTGSNIDDYIGSISLDSTHFIQGGMTYFLEKAVFDARNLTGNMKRMTLKSDYVDALVSGEISFRDLIQSINHQLAVYMPSVFSDSTVNVDSIRVQNFEFKIDLKNTHDITKVLLPELRLSPNAEVNGIYYSDKNRIQVEAKADEIIYKGIHFKDGYLKTNNDEESFMVLAGSNDMIFKQATEKDSTALGLENLNVLATIQNDSLDYRFRWDDYTTEDNNTGYLAGYLKTQAPNRSQLKIYRTDFMVNNSNWTIDPSNLILLDSSRLEIVDLLVKSNHQKFSMKGVISNNASDTLSMNFEDWELSNFDILINNPQIDVDGVLNGFLSLTSLYQAPNIDADLSISNLIFNNEFLGKAKFETFWNPFEKSLYSEVEIASSYDPNKKVFVGKGTYYPRRNFNQLDFDLSLNSFSLHTMEPFVEDFITDIKGSTSGEFKITGTRNKPVLSGELSMNNATAKVDYLNVNYHIANSIQFLENEIKLDNIVLSDSLGNIATTSGSIKHNYLTDFNLDFHFYPEYINCLNTEEIHNSVFYGQANASGDVHIHGPVNFITMDITLESETGTEVNIPLDYNVEVTDTDYIVFVNKTDTVEEKEEIDYTVDFSGVNINMNLSITDNARFNLFLPYGMGGLNVDGRSDMNLNVDHRGKFEIIGDYIISNGNFNLSMQNLLKRKFSIIEGGKISWNGDPYDALINVKALYKTKATPPNIQGLYSAQDEVKRKLNVDCYLSLKDQLFDPEMKFSFELPNVNKETERDIYTLIDTTNEAVMNQQLIYLLVLGAFNTDQFAQAGLGQSSFKLISNQLSNLITQISKDVDIGINYRPGDDLTSEELELALSTQLWDNRVTIDGNFGVVGGLQHSSTTASNIVGDVNIEVKLTKDGRFRIRAFNRSNVNAIQSVNTYDNISPYTQGVGIFYRKEFDKFSDIFKKQKVRNRKKKKKENFKNINTGIKQNKK